MTCFFANFVQTYKGAIFKVVVIFSFEQAFASTKFVPGCHLPSKLGELYCKLPPDAGHNEDYKND